MQVIPRISKDFIPTGSKDHKISWCDFIFIWLNFTGFDKIPIEFSGYVNQDAVAYKPLNR